MSRYLWPAIGAGVLFAVGVGVGIDVTNTPDVVTEVRTVKVPHIIIHEVTKTAAPVPAVAALPQPCIDVIALLDKQTAASQRMTVANGQVLAGLDTLGLKVYEQSVPAVNRLIAYLNVQSDNLDNAGLTLSSTNKQVKTLFSACEVKLNPPE